MGVRSVTRLLAGRDKRLCRPTPRLTGPQMQGVGDQAAQQYHQNPVSSHLSLLSSLSSSSNWFTPGYTTTDCHIHSNFEDVFVHLLREKEILALLQVRKNFLRSCQRKTQDSLDRQSPHHRQGGQPTLYQVLPTLGLSQFPALATA